MVAEHEQTSTSKGQHVLGEQGTDQGASKSTWNAAVVSPPKHHSSSQHQGYSLSAPAYPTFVEMLSTYRVQFIDSFVA